jgi:SRSO17 transposase
MKETTSSAMPPCFDRWCRNFDSVLKTVAQKREIRHYLAGLLGESERKNLSQISNNLVDVTYHKLHHFLTESPWSYEEVNNKRLEIIARCRQTKISSSFALIIDDSGHRKSGNFTDGVGRQYIGEIGKNRKVKLVSAQGNSEERGIEDIAQSLSKDQWIISTYSQRNWIEVFYREIKGWLGLSEYQVRTKTSLMRHFILVFCAYTFIQWHRLTGGFRRQWSKKPLNTFTEALEAFRSTISFRFFQWLKDNVDLFTAYKASLGFVWA